MKKHLKIFIPILTLVIILCAFLAYSKFSKPQVYTTKFAGTSDNSLQGYLDEAQSLSPRGQAATTTVTFLAVGDIMLSRNVAAATVKADNVDYPFLNMDDSLKSTDFNFANLEGPVTATKPVIGGSSLIFGDASSSLKSLKDFNFQIINLANNHAFDQGLDGVDNTISTLNNLGIAYEGTGDNLDQAWTPAIVTANGIKICFVGASFSSLNDGGKVTNNYVARIENADRLKSAITTARSECDFVVATMHAGTEYTRTPNHEQITFAHQAIDDGADIVIGAHPHWVQTVEKYCPSVPPPLPLGEDAPMQRGAGEGAANCQNPKYIFYSLGNFIFDQAFSQDTSEGLTLKIQLSKSQTTNPLTPGAASADDLQGTRTPAHMDSIQLLPVIITNSQPRPATAQETKNILTKIGQTQNTLYP